MLRVFLSGLLLASFAATAQAATVTVDVPLCSLERTVALTAGGEGLTTGAQLCTMSMPLFDPSQGTLNSVNLATTVGGRHVISATNSASTVQTINITARSATGIASSDPAFGGAFQQTYGTTEGTGMGIPVPASGSRVVADIVLFTGTHTTLFTGAEAQGFVGSGSASLDFRTAASIVFLDQNRNPIPPNPALSLSDVISDIGGTLRITYDFTGTNPPASPVPAPGGLGLLLTGLGATAYVRRRKTA
jgi:hypothetical protein